MAGFSDPKKIPLSMNVDLLIRASSINEKDVTPMESARLVNAYQWTFPSFHKGDANSPDHGFIKEDAVDIWRCQPEQWNDGVCDCNCGRLDIDCVGSEAIPSFFVEDVLAGIGKMRLNCPSVVGAEAGTRGGSENRLLMLEDLDPGVRAPRCGDLAKFINGKLSLAEAIRADMESSAVANAELLIELAARHGLLNAA
jgi:hypothetical protein